MEADKPPKIPELDTATYALSYLALKKYAAIIDALPHLQDNPPPATEPQALKSFTTKQNRLLAAVLGSVPIEIFGLLLVPEEDPSP